MSHAITSRLKYLLFSILFITACSPLSATVAGKATPANKTANTASADRESAIQQWINARAAYEKTLDYSNLELENEYKYKTMRTLVEAKYFLMLAEKDLQFNTDKSVALDDFNQARQLLEKAATTINPENKQKLEIIRNQLDKMHLAVKRDLVNEARWMPADQRREFDSTLARIEDILTMQ